MWTMFLFLIGMIPTGSGLLIIHLFFLRPDPVLDATFAGITGASAVSLWLLYAGYPNRAGIPVSLALFLAAQAMGWQTLQGALPPTIFPLTGLMLGSIIAVTLFAPRLLALIFAGLHSLTLLGYLVLLSRRPEWHEQRHLYIQFALDGAILLIFSGLLLFQFRRVYDRGLRTISGRRKQHRRFLKNLRHSQERYRRLAEASFEAILIERGGKILEMNRAFEDLFGYDPENPPASLESLILPEDRRRLPLLLLSRNREVIELNCVRRDGSPLTVEGRSSVVRGTDGMVRSLVLRDITSEKENHRRLEYQANHDPLTGLANRKLLQKRADELLQSGKSCALLLADLDRFKDINETLGHPFGDRVIRRLGHRLGRLYHDAALACRTGGDEFALLIPDPGTEEEILEAAENFRETIRGALVEGSLSLEIEASVGAAVAPTHADDLNGLLRCADVAMYAAKRSQGTSALYTRSMDLDNPRRFQLVTDLGRMIRERSFDLHFQPRIKLSTGRIDGFEVLTRWRHPVLGVISPGELIPLAETGNLIGPLTLAVIEETLMQQKMWAATGFHPTLAVNISARNLSDEDFPSRVIDTIDRFNAHAKTIELEITESAFLHDPRRAMDSAKRLSEAGFSLAIDDFGTGYSSLSYLADLPVRTLKIDLSFVREMLVKAKNLILVSSTIQLGHGLGLSVVAEGVESDDTARALAGMHCDYAQGFHFGMPQPASSILRNDPCDWTGGETAGPGKSL